MKAIKFSAMPGPDAEHIWSGGSDAYAMPPERFISDGNGNPCRHCLQMIGAGEAAFVLAYRPFPDLQPYAETGPIFLHARACPRHDGGDDLPPALDSPDYIVRGYDQDNRIVYGTGAVTLTRDIAARSAAIFARDDVAYVHVRSARNNCFQCRIDREGSDLP
jgi:hypothetical protein